MVRYFAVYPRDSTLRLLRRELAWALPVALLVLAVYLPALGNLPIFDDSLLTEGDLLSSYGSLFQAKPRLVSYGSFTWVNALLGAGWWKQRLVTLLLHLGVVAALWGFYRELLRHIEVSPSEARDGAAGSYADSPALGLAIGFFALNPVAVYAVAYLIQRSIVMATLFTVLALWSFAAALARRQPMLYAAAVACYVLAVLSKEHAIFAPLAALPLYILVARPTRSRLAGVASGMLVLLSAAAFFLWRRYGDILAAPFDEYSRVYLGQLAQLSPEASRHAFGLSVMNEAWLFFEYGVRWFLPASGWLSISLRPPFPTSWTSFPQLLGPLAYLGVFLGALFLLLRYRDWRALVGVSLLLPLVLFPTEFATVWVQDPFVLYRSYLWAIGMPGIVFCLLHGAPGKVLAGVGIAIGALFAWQAVDRVFSLETPESAWSDAIEKLPRDPRAVGRWFPYLNRGAYYVEHNDFTAALHDFDASAALGDLGMGDFNRGAVLYAQGKPKEALEAFDRAERAGYDLYNLPFQRGLALASTGAVREAYEQYLKAWYKDPPSPTREALLMNMGRASLQLGHPENALPALRALRELQPRSKEGRFLLGLALVAHNEPAEAKPLFDELIAEDHSGPAYYGRAMANYSLKKKADAVADIDRAVAADPRNPNLLAWQARIRAMP
jgi:tetratricopeptide (TPR) repeat protein